MPIIVTDMTWRQSDTVVNIQVPLTGIHAKVDLFTTDSYIKAHYSPYLFEIFLLHDVDISKSSCIVKEDVILMDLTKRENIHWDKLQKDLTKPEKLKIKQDLLEKCQEEAKKAFEEKKIQKSQLDRFTVQQAMDIDAKQHALMDSRRDEERKKAMEDLDAWKLRSTVNAEINQYKGSKTAGLAFEPATVTEITSDDEDHAAGGALKSIKKPDKTKKEPSQTKKEVKPKKALPKKEIKRPVRSQYVEKKKEELAKRTLPKLRASSDIEITHTRRTFPTPSRESAAAEEEAWLRNVTMARRATGFVSEDLRPEEQDPQWCKEKGDEFFKNGNFLGAISAYTHGVTLSDKLPSLFSNRAAAHFALGNFNKCANDCSTALELLIPPCEGNRKSRAKCIARRAAALARIGYLNKAIDEMKAAAKLLPDDETIKKDIYDMERAWEQNPDSD